jgi:hypothetical protein
MVNGPLALTRLAAHYLLETNPLYLTERLRQLLQSAAGNEKSKIQFSLLVLTNLRGASIKIYNYPISNMFLPSTRSS